MVTGICNPHSGGQRQTVPGLPGQLASLNPHAIVRHCKKQGGPAPGRSTGSLWPLRAHTGHVHVDMYIHVDMHMYIHVDMHMHVGRIVGIERAVRGPGIYHILPVSPLAEDTKYDKTVSTTGGDIVGSQFTVGAQMITWNVFLGSRLKQGPVPSS